MSSGPVDGVVDKLRGLCGRAVTTLPASGAALSVATKDRQYSLLTAADQASERLEELQFVLGEGPCVDASVSRRPVLVSDLRCEGPLRWPAYTSAMAEAGVCAVFAFPLHVGAAQLGVLDFFRTRPGPLSGAELGRAFALADDAVAILLDGQDRSAENPDAPPMDGATAGPSELFQAQGMVMIQIGSTLAESMSRIRAYAYAENRRLADVAREIVARELRFDLDQ
jgi:GAF domain-containing protein